MHLLAASPGGFIDEEGIIDLQQDAGDIVILSAQDSVLALLARAADDLPDDYPSLRLANLVNLAQPASLDLYINQVLESATVIIVSLLGGESYWPYGVEQLQLLAQRQSINLVLVPGDDQADPALMTSGTETLETSHRVWRYLREGGLANARELYRFIGMQYFQRADEWQEPRPLPDTLIYHPQFKQASLKEWQQNWDKEWNKQSGHGENPVAAILFYRNHLESANTQAFDRWIEILQQVGLNPLPIAVLSLKDESCLATVNTLLEQSGASIILNTTGFSVGTARDDDNRYFSRDIPVLQCILAANSREDWQSSQGLRSRDIAMNIALPEIDGRVISRAVSFKEQQSRSERTQSHLVGYELHDDRARFVAQLARNWAQLSRTANPQKRIALILANYPTRDGRIGNGVGLDTPESTVRLLQAMQTAGFPIEGIPENGTALAQALLSGVTNELDSIDYRHCYQSLALEDYQEYFAAIPEANRQAMIERWGEPEADPKVRNGRIMVPGIRLGETFIGIQPARGYNLDISATYHDPDLVPPHYYLAFYFWIRHVYQAQAVAHIGKHGNLEWLPGKGTALSSECWPEVALGPMPHLYPFIVNDPGEGAQAKRRAQAVIIDHLMPPMTRAETYGELLALEHLVDEYYQAMNLDIKRAELLRGQILDKLDSTQLIAELDINTINNNDLNSSDLNSSDLNTNSSKDSDQVLEQLDAYLCELKEAQIRDGLHILGQVPEHEQAVDTLIALTRLPRGNLAEDQGLLHALVTDLKLGEFDPLNHEAQQAWKGIKPPCLVNITDQPWRSQGDTRERLELLAKHLVTELLFSESGSGKSPEQICEPLNCDTQLDNSQLCEPQLCNKERQATQILLEFINDTVLSRLQASGLDEIQHFIAGLEGKFIPPGPSGAPTRGRLDCLPTGRNFYSVDTRSIPTPTAWQIGQASADALILRHLQDQGDYPLTLGLSVWGTATMRTGGDDIAQAFALMGVKPIWDGGSNRVVDFEIIPGFILNRPRVDVTLRISGFFRDAFSNVVRLFDAAVQAIAELDEPATLNPIRARIQTEQAQLQQQGLSEGDARQQAGWRVFGSKPGAYGAGLQGLIDERCWDSNADLAQAYLNWGSYAYGQDDEGTQANDALTQRLGNLEIVLQNQDNREHDILDSDDYYQFQGGMANAVRVLSRQQPTIYHADHSNPAQPKIRLLEEELALVIRSRAVNPKWLNAIRRHGYKGAFEMAATVDYLFAYDATTDLVADYQYEMLTDAYLMDAENRQFLEQHNPDAMKEMGERLLEAMQRGLWEEPGDYEEQLKQLLLDADQAKELNQQRS